jgi:hypothetical protein
MKDGTGFQSRVSFKFLAQNNARGLSLTFSTGCTPKAHLGLETDRLLGNQPSFRGSKRHGLTRLVMLWSVGILRGTRV